ncbi:MAG: hypothetical protein ACXACT_17700, partial [Candidatus Thorarchaeota archaeon]
MTSTRVLDDFDESSPVWLTYSRKMNSILCYYRDATQTVHPAYAISLANGGVSEIRLLHLDDSNDVLVEVPGAITSIENSDKRQDYVSHHPHSDDTNSIVLYNLNYGEQTTGYDVASTRTTPDEDAYWSALVETGELFVEREGDKAGLKHLIVETYTTSGDDDNTGRPYLVADVKSIEDSDYATSGDAVGTATMTTTALTGSGTA